MIVIRIISPAMAQTPAPRYTCTRLDSLMTATRIPSMHTSTMLHGRRMTSVFIMGANAGARFPLCANTNTQISKIICNIGTSTATAAVGTAMGAAAPWSSAAAACHIVVWFSRPCRLMLMMGQIFAIKKAIAAVTLSASRSRTLKLPQRYSSESQAVQEATSPLVRSRRWWTVSQCSQMTRSG